MLPVGGVRDKVLAARRGGIRHVLLPSRNRGDVEELPPGAADGLRFTFVDNIGDVIFALFASAGDGMHAPEGVTAAAAGDEAAGGGAPRGAGFQSVLHSVGRGGAGGPLLLRRPRRRRSSGSDAKDVAVGGWRGGCEPEDVAGELLESFL